MSRYNKGQTSAAKTEEKNSKTNSLLSKILAIQHANKNNTRIESLDRLAGKRGIAFKSALSWTDESLKLISCAYNTSQQSYNKEYSDQLKSELDIYNTPTRSNPIRPNNAISARPPQKQELEDLKAECEHLKNALAEIYRAYMQLSARVDIKTREDLRYQQVLKNHARAVGKASLILVKS